MTDPYHATYTSLTNKSYLSQLAVLQNASSVPDSAPVIDDNQHQKRAVSNTNSHDPWSDGFHLGSVSRYDAALHGRSCTYSDGLVYYCRDFNEGEVAAYKQWCDEKPDAPECPFPGVRRLVKRINGDGGYAAWDNFNKMINHDAPRKPTNLRIGTHRIWPGDVIDLSEADQQLYDCHHTFWDWAYNCDDMDKDQVYRYEAECRKNGVEFPYYLLMPGKGPQPPSK